MKPTIILITGNMAAGKSTVAQALAERLPKSVHLRGDLFRRMIINGQVPMSFELNEEAVAQLKLRYAIATTVAPMYLQAGFTVIYQDIIIGETLADIVEVLRPHGLHVVVLCPDPAVVATREAERGKRGYRSAAEIAFFDKVLRQETPPIGFWLDTSALTVAESVEQILNHLTAAAV
ncbi:MAG TPA: AAA family ATPase [Caldilineaceae bacterium]|nr:AAA family ATPase [Caldilineaceae bacterium]HRW09356.1 AAA family ATPase [Caldilineaceae bacterium]